MDSASLSCTPVPLQDMMAVRILHVEGDAHDAGLIRTRLESDGLDVARLVRVATADGLRAALGEALWDVVLFNQAMPAFTPLPALDIVRGHDPDLPFLIVSDPIDDLAASAAIQAGAVDYVFKDRLARLRPAIERAMADAAGRGSRRTSEERLRLAVEHQLDPFAILSAVRDGTGRVVDLRFELVNRAACELAGLAPEALIGHSVRSRFPDAAGILDHLAQAIAVIETGEPVSSDDVLLFDPDGAGRPDRFYDLRIVRSGDGCVVSWRGVTDRHLAKEGEKMVSRIYATLASVNKSILVAGDRAQLYSSVCRAVVEHGGIAAAWIGEPDADGWVRPLAHFGRGRDYISGIRISSEDIAEGHGPTGRAFREDHHIVVGDIAADPHMQPWHAIAKEHGFVSSAAFPLRCGGEVVAAICLYATTARIFDAPEIALLDQLAADVSFALDALEAKDRRVAALAQLREMADLMTEGEQVAEFGSWEWNPSTDDLTWSAGIGRLLALPEGLEQNRESLRAAVGGRVAADLFQMSDHEAATLRALRPGERSSREARITNADGSERVFLVVAKRVVYEQGASRIVATTQDVTERRLAEEGLRQTRDFLEAITESMGEGLIMARADDTVGYVNGAACMLLQAAREDAMGRNLQELLIPGTPETATPGTQHLDEASLVRADGIRLPVAVTVSPMRGGDGARVIVFNDDTQRRAEQERLKRELEALGWVGRINRALEEDSLVLYAQPIVDIHTGVPVKYELLIRMRAADGSLIPPGSFLPVAERHGLIKAIDRWVIGQAIVLAQAGHHVWVNLSAQSLADRETADWLRDQITGSGVDPSCLGFEVTETDLLADEAAGEWLAGRLNELGCPLALDDFGTGYGGFTYLKGIRVSTLKIDREFVRDLLTNSASRHIVAAIVALARGFGLHTIAEGVEDQATLEALQGLGVDLSQGFHTGRPAPVAALFGDLGGRQTAGTTTGAPGGV